MRQLRIIRRTGVLALLLLGLIMDPIAFKELLEQNYTWPSVYMFKFVCPASHDNIAYLESLFDSETAEVQIRQSAKGNFVSITAKELMLRCRCGDSTLCQGKGDSRFTFPLAFLFALPRALHLLFVSLVS